MSNEDDGLFREISEDVRKEQLQAIWDKYGIIIMGAIAAIILGVAYYKLSNYWGQQAAEKAADHLTKAESLTEEKKTADALKLYNRLAKAGPEGYAVISKLRAGSLEAADGKTDKAVAAFSSVAKNGSADPIFSEFATIQTAMLTLDKGIPADITAKLKKISIGTSGWRHNALEILALTAYKNKDYKTASTTYAQLISDFTTPDGLKKRSEMMMRVISSAIAKDEETKSTKTDDKAKEAQKK